MTLQYDDIFSVFFSKITDYAFLEYTDDITRGMLVSWLHSALSEPRLQNKFLEIGLDDELSLLSFSLRNPVNDQADIRFVTDILARGMVIAWLEPQVKTVLLTKQLLSGGDEKFYAQANHLSQLEQMLSSAKNELKNILRDYGYINNLYIKGVNNGT